jgi:general secretion pathway protein D
MYKIPPFAKGKVKQQYTNVEARLKQYLIRTFYTLLLSGLFFASPVSAADREVVLNFNDVDIFTLVKFMGDLTGKIFILDDRVKGKFSVNSDVKLSIDEAYEVFVSVLLVNKFAVIEIDNVVKIVPSAALRIGG